jgi:hypothetical protein
MKIIYIVLFVLLILGCKNSSKKYIDRYTLKPSNDIIEIKLNKNSKNLSFYSQYFCLEDVDYLSLLNFDQNSIEIYDLNSRTLFKTIKIEREGENAFGDLMAFHVNNLDSIIIISVMPKTIGIIDTSGVIIRKISFDKDINDGRVKTTIPWGGQRPIITDKLIHLGQIWGAEESSGILTEIGRKKCFVDVSIDLPSGLVRSSKMVYPKELIGKTITQMTVLRALGYKGSFVYHFTLLNNLFVTHDHQSYEMFPIESNYKLKLSELDEIELKKAIDDNISHDEIVDILYDEFRDCYYVFIRKRKEELNQNLAINTQFIYPDCFILILDKNLHYLGEVFFPENNYSFKMVFITPAGLCISEDHVENSTFSEDYMRFKLFTLEKI